MSYILNALRKSEQERQAHQAAKLEDNLFMTHPPKKNWLWWLAAAVILSNIIILAVYFFYQQPASPPKTIAKEPDISKKTKVRTEPLVPIPEDKTQQSQRQRPTQTPIVTDQPKHPAHAQPSFADRVEARPVPPVTQSERIKIKPKTNIAGKPEQQVAVKRQSRNLPVAPAPKKILPAPGLAAVKPGITGVPKPEPSIKKTTPKQDIPWLRSLPFDFRRSMPKLNINVFVYSEVPAERFVIIDMVKYTSGQQLIQGMELKEIRSGSLIVKYKNRTFQIPRP